MAAEAPYQADRKTCFRLFLDHQLKCAQTFSAEIVVLYFPNTPVRRTDTFVHVSTQDSIFIRDMRRFIYKTIDDNKKATINEFYDKTLHTFPTEVKSPKKILTKEMRLSMSKIGSWFLFLHRQSDIIFRWSTGRLPLSTQSIDKIMTESLPAAYQRNNALKVSSPSFSDKCYAVMEFVNHQTKKIPLILEKYMADFEGEEFHLSDDEDISAK